MPDAKKPRSRTYDKSPAGIAARRKYNEEHYARLNLYVSPDLKDRLDKYCESHGVSKNALVNDLLTSYLDLHETGTE